MGRRTQNCSPRNSSDASPRWKPGWTTYVPRFATAPALTALGLTLLRTLGPSSMRNAPALDDTSDRTSRRRSAFYLESHRGWTRKLLYGACERGLLHQRRRTTRPLVRTWRNSTWAGRRRRNERLSKSPPGIQPG